MSLGFGGGRLWPVLNYDNMSSVLSDEKGWSSEADLVGKLIKMYGVHRAVQIVHEYRETYYIEQDFQEMKTHGIKQIRLPMGWWALVDPDADGVVHDPYSDHNTEVRHVPVERKLFDRLFDWCIKYDIKVMIDLHAMPGGSAFKSSFNGVNGIQDATFWQRAKIDYQNEKEDNGLITWRRLLEWIDNLSHAHRAVIQGVQPMNEPAHLAHSHETKTQMMTWMKTAITIFKRHYHQKEYVPNLYINFIETAWETKMEFPNEVHMFMLDNIGGVLNSCNFFLDIHRYAAWGGINPRTPDIVPYLTRFEEWCVSRATMSNGRYQLATTEFSAAFHHISSECVPDLDCISKMFVEQVKSMNKHGIQCYFWSWRCNSMEHTNYWQLPSVLSVLNNSSSKQLKT